jgi:ISXO2-like transposase domain
MESLLSDEDKNFPGLHNVIMLFKKFMKGIHHNVSTKRIQNYLDEFCFRFNRKMTLATINNNLLKKMASSKPYKINKKSIELLKNVA